MNDFFNSPFIQNLSNGKLPEVEVTMSRDTTITLAATVFFVGVSLMLAGKIINKL